MSATDTERWAIMRQLQQAVKELKAANARTRRFIQRVERGDPRVCNTGHENPRYFERFGYDE